MIKIAEISTRKTLRKEFWIDQIHMGDQIEFLEIPADSSQKESFWEQAGKDADVCFIDDLSWCDFLGQTLKKTTQSVSQFHGFDTLVKENGSWWPYAYLRLALHELIPHRAPDLDTQQIAYVTGVSSESRMVISVLVQLGFKMINLVAHEIEIGESILAESRKLYFGVHFNLMRSEDLTLQPNNGSVLVNTVPLVGQEEVIEDLSYLNFIIRHGLVVEVNALPMTHQLLSEATNMGLRVVSGVEVFIQTDIVRFRKLGIRLDLETDEYQRRWLAFMSEKQSSEKPVEGPVT